MTWFEAEKRKRNLADGCKETKGLRNGHCNRRACQRSLTGERQFSMCDHETFTDARLYYCAPCAFLFNEADDRMREPRRCSEELIPAEVYKIEGAQHFDLRPPKRYDFRAQPDITAYELAQCLPPLIVHEMDIEAWLATMPQSVQRHFVEMK